MALRQCGCYCKCMLDAWLLENVRVHVLSLCFMFYFETLCVVCFYFLCDCLHRPDPFRPPKSLFVICLERWFCRVLPCLPFLRDAGGWNDRSQTLLNLAVKELFVNQIDLQTSYFTFKIKANKHPTFSPAANETDCKDTIREQHVLYTGGLICPIKCENKCNNRSKHHFAQWNPGWWFN